MTNIEKANGIANKILSTGKISPTIETLESIDEIANIMKDENHYLSSLYTTLSLNYYQAIDKRIRKETRNKVFACKSGCSDCCKKLKIVIPTLEIDYLVDYLNSINSDTQEIIANNLVKLYREYEDKKINTIDRADITIIKQEQRLVYDCPFLINDLCSVYDARPILCRTYLSKNKQICLEGRADNVLESIYASSFLNLLNHDKNKSYTTQLQYGGNFPFFAIKYGNGKFYSLNKYNKFVDYIGTLIK